MSDVLEHEGELLGVETHSEADEKALLGSLGDDQDFDPSGITADESVSDAMMLEFAAAEAVMWLGVGELFLQEMVHPDFHFNEELAEKFGKKAAPLMMKYGGELPPWLKEYKEEIGFAAAAGALGFMSWRQIKALKAEDVEKDKSDKPETDTEKSEAA
ncbi:hypothetical protein [Photobacterium salinisoli]|uniref:hypothetical protein n=1 Tax=Photobacterium salinisoli TaxID=1616783 RepID=UPI000EA06622|nr:hypothetical protein [Photobacterium salinisoli]